MLEVSGKLKCRTGTLTWTIRFAVNVLEMCWPKVGRKTVGQNIQALYFRM